MDDIIKRPLLYFRCVRAHQTEPQRQTSIEQLSRIVCMKTLYENALTNYIKILILYKICRKRCPSLSLPTHFPAYNERIWELVGSLMAYELWPGLQACVGFQVRYDNRL